MPSLMNFLSIFFLVISSSIFGRFELGENYFCEDNFGGGVNGVFGILQLKGTKNPYIRELDKDLWIEDYVLFRFSSYPYPIGYVPLVKETETEIFLQGSHDSSYSKSKQKEFFSIVIDKEKLLISGELLNFKGETQSIESKCCIEFIEMKRLEDGTFSKRECK